MLEDIHRYSRITFSFILLKLYGKIRLLPRLLPTKHRWPPNHLHCKASTSRSSTAVDLPKWHLAAQVRTQEGSTGWKEKWGLLWSSHKISTYYFFSFFIHYIQLHLRKFQTFGKIIAFVCLSLPPHLCSAGCGWWLVLICCERKVLLTVWWLVASADLV